MYYSQGGDPRQPVMNSQRQPVPAYGYQVPTMGYQQPMGSYVMPQMQLAPQAPAVEMASQQLMSASKAQTGEQMVRKQSSKKTAKPNGNMYISIAVAMVGAAMFGLDQGNFGNVQTFDGFIQEWCVGNYGDILTCNHEYMKDNPNKEWENNFIMWGATLITYGAAAGALLLGPVLTNKLGRRPCILAGGAICFVGCLVASYLSMSNITTFMVGRFITGFGVGVSCFALPLYNSEISTPGLRGTTGSLFQLNVVVGCFISCLITLVCDDWKFGILMPGIAGAFLMVAAPFIPESPRFVMEKKGYDQGVAELERIRSGDVTVEANEMQQGIEEEQGVEQVSFIGLCQERNLRKRVIIACTLVACQQATGVNAFLGYAGTIFEKCGIKDPILFNTVFNCIMIFGCVAGLLMVDSKYGGRKKQLLLASIIMGPPLLISGYALRFDNHPQDRGWDNLKSNFKYDWNGIIVMACVCIYGVGFQFAWGTIPWVYPSEIFSMSEKENAVSLAVFVNYINNAIVIMITPAIMQYSVPGTMYFFGVANVFCGLFVWAFIKETKGVPLEDVPALFRSDGGSSSEDGEY
eukprot:TRINITY_DN45357_c0_g1_i1.p1 TRINITY_DN45357_c0_g1~~TRINITY_DN45357_c0_g1_i1.p1  ORF type:complete len:577 (+),score=134.77 TRINITY_DN45357_c0_g1_i1:60-1790(+)